VGEAQLVVFKLAGEQFAAPIGRVREILRPVKATRMPRTAGFVRGLFNLRGQVLPLLDLRLRLGLRGAAAPAPVAPVGAHAKDNKARVVVVEAAGEALGIQVDEVLEVLRCREEDLQAPDSVLEMPSSRSLGSVLDLAGRLVLVLDVDRLLDGAVSEPALSGGEGAVA
jgi:purine-binding chemotaxis protein CheW